MRSLELPPKCSLLLLFFVVFIAATSTTTATRAEEIILPKIIWEIPDHFAIHHSSNRGRVVTLYFQGWIANFVEDVYTMTFEIDGIVVHTSIPTTEQIDFKYQFSGYEELPKDALNPHNSASLTSAEQPVFGGHVLSVKILKSSSSEVIDSRESVAWIHDFDKPVSPIVCQYYFKYFLSSSSFSSASRHQKISSLGIDDWIHMNISDGYVQRRHHQMIFQPLWNDSVNAMIGITEQHPTFFFPYFFIGLLEEAEGNYETAFHLVDVAHKLILDPWNEGVRHENHPTTQVDLTEIFFEVLQRIHSRYMTNQQLYHHHYQLDHHRADDASNAAVCSDEKNDDNSKDCNKVAVKKLFWSVQDTEEEERDRLFDQALDEEEEEMVKVAYDPDITLQHFLNKGKENDKKKYKFHLTIYMHMQYDKTIWCNPVDRKDTCIDRFRVTLNTLLFHIRQLNKTAEIIVLEWAPKHQSLLSIVLENIEPQEGITLRILTVPDRIANKHLKLKFGDVREYMAKMSAGRRARGKFICVLNIDTVLSKQLVAQLYSSDLDENVIYTASRGTLDTPIPRGNAFMTAEYVADRANPWPLYGAFPSKDYAAPCGDDMGGFPLFLDQDEESVAHKIFEIASGDFTLMARAAFIKIRGYSEAPIFEWLDGAIHNTAIAHGMGQLVFTPPCFGAHQDHGRTFPRGWSDLPLQQYLASKPECLKRRKLCNIIDQGESETENVHRIWYKYNGPNWGLRKEKLPEVVLVARRDAD